MKFIAVWVLALMGTVAALSTTSASAQQRTLRATAVVKGFCNKFIAYDKDVTDRCDDKVVNAEYSDGRNSFTFISTDGVLVVTFSGEGKKQIHLGADVTVQPLDLILANFQGQGSQMKAVGTCKFTNPYDGKASITCAADTPPGQFSGSFITDGDEPFMKRFRVSREPSTAASVGRDWPQRMAVARQRMYTCLQKFPTPANGTEEAVQKEIERDVASCGQEYLALGQEGGMSKEQAIAASEVDAYKALGCRYANPTDADIQNTPQGMRLVACSAQAKMTLAR